MTDIIRLISDSLEIYKKNYALFILPLIIMLIISIIFGIPNMILSNISLPSKTTADLQLLIAFRIITGIISGIFISVGVFLSIFILTALQPVIFEMIQGRQPGSWIDSLKSQAGNGLKLALLNLALEFIIALPLLIWAALNIGTLLAVAQGILGGVGKPAAATTGALTGALFGANVILLFLLALVSILLSLVLRLLLTFLVQEMVLGGKGVLASIKGSISLLFSNAADVILFYIAWFLINAALSVVSLFSICCLCIVGPFLFSIVELLIVTPIRLISNVYLWAVLSKKVALKPQAAAAPAPAPAPSKPLPSKKR